ncbi:MAG TPA: hypothetical protein DD666_16160 [Advenella kashmirensis]|uniref:Uncharacterized protein n=1 Tax=Advenella kashmirensis TaxID=310575 RepID=A0A356LJM5_9BURK|nr:hypothetical protein [Advenella kashmirensis]
MLIYHPVYDAYHCVFRMLTLAEHLKNLEVDKARLLDFYLVFPGAMESIRLSGGLKPLRKIAKNLANEYRDPVSNLSTFREMRHIQEAALKSIAASGLIDIDRYKTGYVDRTAQPIPGAIEAKIQEFMSSNLIIKDAVLNKLAKMPLLGTDGLKHRSKLLEYRYDVV